MKVFVAGASGAIGRFLIPRLVAAEHSVMGMTRSEEKAAALREQGAEAVVADIYDAERVHAAIAGFAPEVVVHQLTALPQAMNLRKLDQMYGPTARIRREGTRTLIDAARAAGARRIVAQSIAFLYALGGKPVKTEEDPPLDGLSGGLGEVMDATVDLERQVTNADGLEGLVLRYGYFYGPGTYYAADSAQSAEVRKRRMPLVGEGAGLFSFIHLDDAAAATVAALDRGSTGIYNIVDDEPAAMREWLPAYAEALGAKKPFRVPAWIARLAAPRQVVEMATAGVGASNAKAKRELAWEPRYASWREGFAAEFP